MIGYKKIEVPEITDEYGDSCSEITSIEYHGDMERLIVQVEDDEVPDGWYEYSFVAAFDPDTEEVIVKDGSAVGATDVEGSEEIPETTVVDVVQATNGVEFDI
jgi:hypothetical protein